MMMRKGIVMKYSAAAVLAMACTLMLSCTKEAAPGTIESVFEGLSRARGFGEASKFYTDGTVRAIERAASRGGIPVSRMGGVLLPFHADSRWKVVSRKGTGDSAEVTITFVEHPVQNLVGFSCTCRMAKRGGEWKIDLEREVSGAMDSRREDGAAEYLRKIGRSQ
jgi:hypothetical protein